jgi:hypothetical protein
MRQMGAKQVRHEADLAMGEASDDEQGLIVLLFTPGCDRIQDEPG